jgi:hypothetical protein
MLALPVQRELETHSPMSTVLRALRAAIGLAESDIERLTESGPGTTRRWLKGSASPRAESADRIDQLRCIVVVLGDSSLEPENIVAWLRNRNPHLEWRRPLDVLVAGDFDAVLKEAKSVREVV